MKSQHWSGVDYRASGVLIALLLFVSPCTAQKKVTCADGDRIIIDVKEISIKYDASSFAGTLSSLSVLGARLEVAPKKLQEAAVATQQWDEFLKGLAAGYNSCAITKQQYNDGLNRIYPRLKEDASGLEAIRKELAAGQKADTKRLQQLVGSFYANLQQFAKDSGSEVVLERIQAVSEQIASGNEKILKRQSTDTNVITTKEDQILALLKESNETNQKAPLPTPSEVSQTLSETRNGLAPRIRIP